MSQKPTIAVAIFTMNRKDMLRETIRSVLNQTVQADEIFVSDNSDQPDTTLLEEFPGAPLKYHCHDRRLHIEEHWGWCLGQPMTDYVMCMEDDNLLLPNHIERFSEAAQKYPAASLFCSVSIIFNDVISSWQTGIIAPVWQANLYTKEAQLIPRDLSIATFFFGIPFASSAVMISRKARDTEGAFKDTRFRNSHDRWRWAQFAVLGDTVYIPEVTVLYRVHPGNHTWGTRRSQHIDEGKQQEVLTLGLMKRHNIDPDISIKKLVDSLAPRQREQLVLWLMRGRTWKHITRFMPIIVNKPNISACLPTMAKVFFRQIAVKFLGA